MTQLSWCDQEVEVQRNYTFHYILNTLLWRRLHLQTLKDSPASPSCRSPPRRVPVAASPVTSCAPTAYPWLTVGCRASVRCGHALAAASRSHDLEQKWHMLTSRQGQSRSCACLWPTGMATWPITQSAVTTKPNRRHISLPLSPKPKNYAS